MNATKTTKTTQNNTAKDLLQKVENYRKSTANTITATNRPQPPKAPQEDFYQLRNQHRNTATAEEYNTKLLYNIAITATYSTLDYLIAHGATTETATADINEPKKRQAPFGYNMALKLRQDLPQDINTLTYQKLDNTYSNSIDLIQEVATALLPFVRLDIDIEKDTVIYTKILKNGNEKNYTLFSLACYTVRQYMTAQAQKQYKKQYYCIGFTDNGTEILTTKKQKTTCENISTATKQNILNRYQLTAKQQKVIILYADGLNVEQIANTLQISFEDAKKTLYRAKKQIKENR